MEETQRRCTVSVYLSYVTNVKCVLILDMVPTEICLEVDIPYVGPNDGER